jgi:putative DNA primase/helicase
MINSNDIERAVAALFSIPADLPRDEWVKLGMAFQAAGGSLDDFDRWSASAPSYNKKSCRATWLSFKSGKGIGTGTLYHKAAEYGWTYGDKPPQKPIQAPTKPVELPRQHAPGKSPSKIWERCKPATNTHGYIVEKRAAGVPLDNLKVVPEGDPLRIANESMAGALVVPITRGDGTLSSLQFVTTGATAEQLKAQGKPSKLNLTGCPVDGFFTVGEIVPGGVVNICEGIATAWSCWQATGGAAVSCFGWGRVRTVAAELRQRDATAVLVLVPDGGKELDARKIANDVDALVVAMPPGEANNFDANDYAQREGIDALGALMEGATAPPKPKPRYKLLGADDLRNLPPFKWRVCSVLPAAGLAGLYGPSASGKSFLALHMAAAIAEGSRWFDCRVEAAPVVYAALEGEAGFKLRVAAWEAHQGRPLPAGLYMVLQPFNLTEPQDVADLAAVIPAGAVLFIDTLNRAAPTADENSSKDMGEILSAAKQLQNMVGGLVVMVHHTGKDTTKGLRGHSSLLAALDAAVEVARDGDRRDWKVAKSKDGQDGNAQAFRLKVETLGLDEYGDPLTSCVVVQDHTERDIKRVKVPQGGNQGLVYNAIRDMFIDGEVGKPGAPPLRPCIRLEAAVIRGASALTCETHRRATRSRAAITALVSRGVLGLNDGWLWTP